MENLKRFLLILIAAMFINSANVYSQDAMVMKDAFSKSYAFEYNKLYDKAIEAIKAVYSETNYEMNMRLGWLYYIKGSYSESLPYYEKAINQNPKSIEARLSYVNPASALGNWDKVVIQYNKILEIDQLHSAVNYRLGLYYYNVKDYNKALTYLERISPIFPLDYDITSLLAWTYYKLGKNKEAKQVFQRLLNIMPTDVSALDVYKKL